jgi:uncharacterized delta-60 repeat protein
MARFGAETSFGLRGVTSHVDGFGGIPLAVFSDSDGRPTIVCVAPARQDADLLLSPAGRARAAKVPTIRIVSFPSTGRPWGGGPTVAVSSDPVDVDVEVLRVITSPNRVAVLVATSQHPRRLVRLLEYRVTGRTGGVNRWGLVQQQDIANAVPEHTTIGWDGMSGGVLVIEVNVGRTIAPRTSTWYVTYTVRTDPRTKNAGSLARRVSLPDPSALPARFALTTTPGPLLSAADGRVFVPLSVEGIDPDLGVIRLLGAVDAARAIVLCLTADANGGWDPDPGFGSDGVWVSATGDPADVGVASVATFLADGNVAIAGRSRSGGAEGVTVTALDATAGTELWSNTVATVLPRRPVELIIDPQGRVVLAGFIDPTIVGFAHSEGMTVVRFDRAGTLDATFGFLGTAAVRLHGPTVPAAICALPAGGYLVAGSVHWGRFTSASILSDPCVAKLADDGRVDTGFGDPGMCRHDGLGQVSAASWGPTGMLWTAGVRRAFVGMIAPMFPNGKEHATYDWTLTVSRLDSAGELPVFVPWAQKWFPMTGFVRPQDGNAYDVSSIVALQSGGAIVCGIYETLTIDEATGEVALTFGGSWLVRMRADGTIDPTFGTTGVVSYPNKSITLAAELADGSLHGSNFDDVIRLRADGAFDATFATNGSLPMGPHDWSKPRVVEADGSWFDVTGDEHYAGLIRYLPNGHIDPAFGTAANAGAVIAAASLGQPAATGVNLQWDLLGDHRTFRLADGTYLTLWSATFENQMTTTTAVVLLAWNADGSPRPVLEWSNKAARFTEPPGPVLIWRGWYNRRPRCGMVQADGSLLVGVAVDLPSGGGVSPRPLPWRSAIWRLIPPGFELDPSFGGTGAVEVRLADDGYNDKQGLVEVQEPIAFAAGSGQEVYASILCNAVFATTLSQNAPVTVVSPELPFDGSIGIVRLV